MTNKLVVVIKSLKVPKIKKILLFEIKFLVPNYSCLQNPWLGTYRPKIPVLSVLCPQLNLLKPPRTKFLGTPLISDEVSGFHHGAVEVLALFWPCAACVWTVIGYRRFGKCLSKWQAFLLTWSWHRYVVPKRRRRNTNQIRAIVQMI